MLGWLPIIGPVIEGIVSAFNKSKDTTVAIKRIEADKEATIIQSSQQTAADFRDQLDLRIARDIVIYPVCVYTALFTWDKIVVLRYPDLVWGVDVMREASGLAFLPYAVLTFLLGAAAMYAFKK